MIDTVALKKRVLEKAFQGLLTEQQTSHSNVEQIIENCSSDKAYAIETGKYKREEFRGAVKNTLVDCQIPSTWRWMYISDMSLFQEGPGILGKDFRKEGIPLIRIAGMDGTTVKLKGCNYLDPEMVNDKWNHFRLDIGDILISSSASLDRIAEVDEEAEGAIPYTGLIRFKMYGGINKDYFTWFVKSPYYIGQVNAQKKGGFIQHYGPTHLRKMLIPIPPIEEQIQIVEILNSIFACINTIDKLQSAYSSDLEVLKSKIIDAGIQGKLTEQLLEDGNAEDLYATIQEEKSRLIRDKKIKKPKALLEITEDEIPFEIPANWKWVRLNDIGTWVAGATPSRRRNDYYGGSIPWVKTGELNNGYIDDTEEHITELALDESSVILNPVGSVLIAMYGATIGKVAILNIEATTNQACCACNTYKGINNRFLFYYLICHKADFIRRSHGGAQPNISKEIILNEVFPLPPLNEQKRIIEKLDSIMNEIS